MATTRADAVLAGDVGGTHTRLALFAMGTQAMGTQAMGTLAVGTLAADAPTDPLLQRVYPSADFPGLEPIVRTFLAEAAQAIPQVHVRRAGFGVAGPAEGAVVKFTNLPWVVRTDDLARAFALEQVVFVNDFAAICRAVPHLRGDHLLKLGGDEPAPGHPKAVLGAGTGLGMGFLVHGPGGYRAVASEGGHVGFAPRDDAQLRLVRFLQKQRDGSYAENLLSGRGLDNLYMFLRDVEGAMESPAVRTEKRTDDPAAVISKHGLAGTDPLCRRTLEWFCSIYGAVAGGLALLVMARGGIYLAGGIAGHIQSMLAGDAFRNAFEEHVRYAEFLRTVPRYLITHPQPGLLGAALAARENA